MPGGHWMNCSPAGTRAWSPGGGNAGWRSGWPPKYAALPIAADPAAEGGRTPGRVDGDAAAEVVLHTVSDSATDEDMGDDDGRGLTARRGDERFLRRRVRGALVSGALYSLSRKEGWCCYVQTRARQRPEQLDAGADWAVLGTQAREEYDEARHDWHANFGVLRTPQLAAVCDELDQIVAPSNRQDPDRVRGAAVIDALPGLGKTTAATSFARALDRAEMRRHGTLTSEGHERIPVFRVGLTS